MALTSIGICPWCGARIQLKKQSGVFKCPICDCIFRHKWSTWPPCIVSAILAVVVMYKLIPNILPIVGLFVIIVLIGAIGKFLGYYVVVAIGREDVTEEEVKSYAPKIKESKWFIVLVILTALAVLSFIVLVNIYR